MTRYEQLPIYADAYRLAELAEQQVQGLANTHRAAIGENLRGEAQLMLRCESRRPIVSCSSVRQQKAASTRMPALRPVSGS